MPDSHVAPPFNFGVTAEIRGSFTVERLAAALEKVRVRYPAIAAHFVLDDGIPWYDSENVPPFSIRVTEGDWTAELVQELGIGFNMINGPANRFVMVRNNVSVGLTEDITHLIIICNHGIADGLSGAFALRDALYYMAYPDAPIEPLPMPPDMWDILPPYDPIKMPLDEPFENPDYKVRYPEDKMRNFIITDSLTPIQTAELTARCRREGTTVHAALCVAFLVALTRLEGAAPVRIVSSPVNLRGHLMEGLDQQFGNFINPGVKVAIAATDTRDFWEMARQVKADMMHETADGNIFKSLYWFSKMWERTRNDPSFKFLQADNVAPYDLSITTLGRLNFPVNYSDLRLEAIYGPAVNPQGREKVIGVSTINGVLTFTFVAPYRLIAPDEARQWMTSAIHELADAIS